MEMLVFRLISRTKGKELAETFRDKGLRVTEFDGRGRSGPVSLLYVILNRVDAATVEQMAEDIDPDVFIAIDYSRDTNRTSLNPVLSATGWRSWVKKK